MANRSLEKKDWDDAISWIDYAISEYTRAKNTTKLAQAKEGLTEEALAQKVDRPLVQEHVEERGERAADGEEPRRQEPARARALV